MSDPIRFHLDESVNPAVAEGLRRRGIDVTTARDAGLLGASDEAHLEFARREARVLFSHDSDFLKLHAYGTPHAGIVHVRQQTPVGYSIRGLLLIHQVLLTEEIAGRVEFL